MTTTTQAQAFLTQLADPAFRKQHRLALLDVREGDWESVVAIGAQAGFAFTVDELREIVPIGFFRGNGAKPDSGWDMDTLWAPIEPNEPDEPAAPAEPSAG